MSCNCNTGLPGLGIVSRGTGIPQHFSSFHPILYFYFYFLLLSHLLFHLVSHNTHPIYSVKMGNTTLLVLDIQNAIVDIFDKSITDPYLKRLAAAISAARQENINIIHVVTGFRPYYPECHTLNASFSGIISTGKFQEGSKDVQVHPTVAPLRHEPVIMKRRVSAFMGTELDMILRSSKTDHLVIAGIATSGAILSTIRQAQDLDFKLTVLRDLCLDRDEEVHRVLIDKVFGRKMDVFNADEWIEKISGEKTA